MEPTIMSANNSFFSPIHLLVILIFTLLFYYSLKSKPCKKGFNRYPILGTIPDFLANRHRMLEWTTEVLSLVPTQTATFYRPVGGVHGVFTANPENIEHILKHRFTNYPKGPRFLSMLRDFLGDGIFNSDGDIWHLQRKTTSFEFNKRGLKNFLLDSVKSELKTRLQPVLKEAARMNRVLDLQDVLERFAFDNVCKLAFNVDPGCLGQDKSDEDGFMKAFNEATALSCGRFTYALPMSWKIKKLFNFGSERKLRDAIKTVHEYADNIIRKRVEEKNKIEESIKLQDDLLSRFIVNEENPISVELLRDVVISVILAGKDTTSTGLSWLFWLLSSRPYVVDKIRAEVERIRIQNGKSIGDTYDYDEIHSMHYLHAVISESLRLYPPIPVDTKACLEDDVLPDGTMVRKGWFVLYHNYAVARMEDVWGKDCEEFLPERWLDDDGTYKPQSMFKFSVFNAGPRVCLGKEMAYIQMKSIVASILEQFDVDVLGKENRPDYLLSLTLRMKDGLFVRLKERNKKACLKN